MSHAKHHLAAHHISALVLLVLAVLLFGAVSVSRAQSLDRIERERAQTMLGVKLDPATAGKFFPLEWK